MYNSKSLRLIFFGIGLIAVVALTGMNIISMHELRKTTIEIAQEDKKNQIEEFTTQVRYRFFQPFRAIRRLDISHLQQYYDIHNDFPDTFKEEIIDASLDSIFYDIYYSPHDKDHCIDDSRPIYKFNRSTRMFEEEPGNISQLVCDGLGLAKTRLNVLIDEYRWNIKASFDTHRSMTLSMFNLHEREIMGHLIFTINRDYLVHEYLAKNLTERFGPSEETGIVVWLRDFMQDEILTSSDPDIPHNRDFVDIRQRFPDLLENWSLHAKIIDSPTIAATNASLFRNLFVLVSAVLALFGALLFMFLTSKRERELAQRQAGFLANVTHELKTPLAAMQAAGENLSDGRVTDKNRIKSYGDHIYTETIRLRKMIEKLLDIARVDSGHNTVQLTPHKLQDQVEEYFNNHKSYVKSKGFRFKMETDPNLPEVLIDPDHFETIISNLVDNAIKYSFEKKEINLSVKKTKSGVRFTVTDKGIGIPKKSHQQIFEKFYRLEDSMTAKTKGHGLGLSIVKKLVELNHGSIDLKSSPGKGTSFIVEFPAYEPSHETGMELEKHYEYVNKELQATDYVK
jgi:signal transduction histidine kinase